MDEDLLKSNTDCVYFLASPFTCKKGVECEYRHSEMARLNPRDCWYWLSGNCLNLACAFRHPPLDVHNEAPAGAAPANQSAGPATKTTVPCYFYYNGFCNKGDKCSFLHDPCPSDAFGQKPKIVNTTGADALLNPSDSKIPVGVDAVCIPAENSSVSLERKMVPSNVLQGEQKVRARQATVSIPKANLSEQLYVPKYEEIATFKTVSIQPAEGLTKSEGEPSLGSDQSSEELIDGYIVRDEWESSPGFDVLVDGRTGEDNYEDDPEYLHALDGNEEDSERLLIPHDFACQTEIDERGFFDNNGLYEPSDYFQDELGTYTQEYCSRRTRDRNARRVACKRNFVCVESAVGGRHDVDLRDYLRKRRMVDGIFETLDLRHELVRVRNGDRQERSHRYGSTRRIHRRLGSKVEKNGVRLSRRQNLVADSKHRVRSRNSQYNGIRQYNGRHSQHYLTDRSSYSKRERNAQELTTFSGPRRLAEIKQGKMLGHFNKNSMVDFEGPKPLSEILKDKKKTASSPYTLMSSGN